MGPTLRLPGLRCPCGRDATYAACCAPIHRDLTFATRPEQVMRARYTAFVRGDVGFLMASWDASTRPPLVDLDPDLSWTGLEVTGASGADTGEDEGWVTFVARYQRSGVPGALRERSRFRREHGCWRYVDGVTPR